MTRTSGWWRLVLAGSLAVGLAACGSADIGGGGAVGAGGDFGSPGGGWGAPSDFGATQGGVQDMSLARTYVEEGFVPMADAFVVEGMFSEHDLPLTGPACHTTLCLRTAMGVAPTLDGVESAWMQVGMSSTVNPDTFVREPQTLIFTVDVSGSMGWEYGDLEVDYPRAGALSRALLHDVVDELGPDDRVAIVTYGSSVTTALGFVAATDDRVRTAIDALGTDGSTNMEAGLQRAYELAATAGSDRPVRVMLFTDMRPNVGATTPTEFQQIVGAGADEGVGLTVFGLGVGLGPALFEAVSHLRGGNAFSLSTAADVEQLMADSWPWMVSPIAEDLAVRLAADAGYRVAEAYGFPGHEEAEASFEVATVFLSRRKGGLLLRLEPEAGTELAGLRVEGTLSYQDLEAGPITQTVSGHVDGSEAVDPKGRFFEQPSVGKAVALALLVSGMHDAAQQYVQTPEDAAAHMRRVRDRFQDDVEALGDAALEPELAFATRLLDLMESGAEARDLYGR